MIHQRAVAPTADGIVLPPMGRPASDSLGCASSKLHQDQELAGAGIRFYRKRSEDTALGHVTTPACDRGFLVGVSRHGGHRRRIMHAHHASWHDFDPNAVYVRSFSDTYRADMQGPFDFLLMEITPACLDRAFDDAGIARADGLRRTTGQQDLPLAHLMSALLPALARPTEASQLFVDQVGTAILTHLTLQYGGAPARAGSRIKGLSPRHEQRAKEMLLSRMDGSITVAEVAEACNLSRSYFTFAFREATGKTPHQWLQMQRVERAREMLQRTSMPLAEVAGLCGFADQSHFTRVFGQATGVPPGHWRRHGVQGRPTNRTISVESFKPES